MIQAYHMTLTRTGPDCIIFLYHPLKLTAEARCIVSAISWLVGTVAVKLQSVSRDGCYQIVYSVEFSGKM